MDLTSWAFNGVAKDHPQFEGRLAAWTAEVLLRPCQKNHLMGWDSPAQRAGMAGSAFSTWPTVG